MVFEAFALWRILRLTAPSNLIVRSFKSMLVERCPINFKFSGLLALLQKHFSLRYLEQAVLNPHFSHPLYCISAMIRPDCVALRRPPQRTLQYVCGGLGRAWRNALRSALPPAS